MTYRWFQIRKLTLDVIAYRGHWLKGPGPVADPLFAVRRLADLSVTIIPDAPAVGGDWELLKAWPRKFTECRRFLVEGDVLWAGVGAAKYPFGAELWRHDGEWTCVGSWPKQARILDIQRISGDIHVALGASYREGSAQVLRLTKSGWQDVSCWPVGHWRLAKRLIIHEGIPYAGLLGRLAGDSAQFWRLDTGEPVALPFTTGIYEAIIWQGAMFLSTEGEPSEIWRFGDDKPVAQFHNKSLIESFVEYENNLVFTVGRRAEAGLQHPVWSYDGTSISPLGNVVPGDWLINNNWNTTAIVGGRLYIESGGHLSNTSVSILDRHIWRQIASHAHDSWPGLAYNMGRGYQWLYHMVAQENKLVIGFAGHRGAAQAWRFTPDDPRS